MPAVVLIMNEKKRKSHAAPGRIYFGLQRVKWYRLLKENNMKNIITDYLKILSDEKKLICLVS